MLHVHFAFSKDHKIILPDTAKHEVTQMLDYFSDIGLDYITDENFIYLEGVGRHSFSTVVMSYADQIPEFSDRSYTSLVPFTSATAIELMGIKYAKQYGLQESLSLFLNDKSFKTNVT